MSAVQKVFYYLLATASFVLLHAMGFRLTEQFMERWDSRAEKHLDGMSP